MTKDQTVLPLACYIIKLFNMSVIDLYISVACCSTQYHDIGLDLIS